MNMNLKMFSVISCLLILLFSCRQETILYVDQSTKTTSNANGSIESPFRDVESALNAVHKIREKDGTQQIKIIFRKGTYFFDKGFLIEPGNYGLSRRKCYFFGRKTDTGKSYPTIQDWKQ
ncbi:hypothetical protein NBH15_15280 [Parabacteroides sp. W1-Q-101]|uniref:hypothetical protein n=1 Tax=Parabacteroides caeci TaxID=2949650 RepID=UPI00202F8FD2|nr:hypothetical protein [Parabacteroides sp. W1-Q-101]MCM0719634.1 hypothetical protein [Parabacteroides sp. W1-Q-101]